MVACYLHLFIIFPQSTYARGCARTYTPLHRHSARFATPVTLVLTVESLFFRVVISNCRFVLFILLLNSLRGVEKTEFLTSSSYSIHIRIEYRGGCNRMRRKEEKKRNERKENEISTYSFSVCFVNHQNSRFHVRAHTHGKSEKNALLLRKEQPLSRLGVLCSCTAHKGGNWFFFLTRCCSLTDVNCPDVWTSKFIAFMFMSTHQRTGITTAHIHLP